MKIYQRIESKKGYLNITTVAEDGVYIQKNVWPDGTADICNKTTLEKMGWESLEEFLSNRPGYVLVK